MSSEQERVDAEEEAAAWDMLFEEVLKVPPDEQFMPLCEALGTWPLKEES